MSSPFVFRTAPPAFPVPPSTVTANVDFIIFLVVIVVVITKAIVILWVYMGIKKPKSNFWSCCGCLPRCCMICLGPGCISIGEDPPEEGAESALKCNRRSSCPCPEVSKAFTYAELVQATYAFSPSNLLGEGGFGPVYKGTIAGNLVAVKNLKIGSRQGEREFRAEVEIISRVHHRHLVSLVGYCISDIHRLLVYKYVPNGTLEEALHGPGKPVMDWATRMNIALGTARGLAYLHEDCHPRIIHRDIKGSNILLDNQWEAQVADFGLAKLADEAQTHMTTRVVGTFGYMAPEYAMSGRLTDKSDVYSFGVVLLELITGKKAVDRTLPGADAKQSLVEWARTRLTEALKTGNVDALADENLRHNYEEKQMFRMIEVAAICVRRSSHKRPKMADVLRRLSTEGGDLHQGVLPGYSNEFAEEEAAGLHVSSYRLNVFSSSGTQSSSDCRTDARVPSSAGNELGSASRVYPATTLILGSDEIV